MTINEEKGWVLDTNVLVSAALIRGSVSFLAFGKALATGNVIYSKATMDELQEVLRRRKFDRYLTLDERQEFINKILKASPVIEVTTQVTRCRDPKDNKFLELAIDGYADGIISGDQDLLILHPFDGIPILTPGQFLQQEP